MTDPTERDEDDPTSPLQRPSQEQKRSDETMMLSSENLDDMVSQASTGGSGSAPAAGTGSGASADDRSDQLRNILIGVGGVVLIVLVFIVFAMAD